MGARWTWVVAVVVSVALMGCKSKDTWHPVGFPGDDGGGDGNVHEEHTFTPEFHFQQGMDYYGAGKLDDAEKQFWLAIEQKKDYVEAWNALGYVYHYRAFIQINSRKSKEAIDFANKSQYCFDTALKTNPKLAEALVGLSLLNFDQYYYFTPHNRDYRLRAMHYLDEAQKIAPNSQAVQSNVCFNRAKLFLLEKGYEQATPDLERVVSFEQVPPAMKAQAHFLLGGCYAVLRNSEKAIDNYRKYLEILPNAPNKEDVNDILIRIERNQYPDSPPAERPGP